MLRWTTRPRLRRPAMICAFEGWNDAGDAASSAARYLAERWELRPFADLDPEEYFDFTTTRPRVRLDEGHQREVVWPANDLLAGSIPGADRDVIVLSGTEPQLRWRTFCGHLTEVAQAFEAEIVVTLGALLAEVPHSRPVSVIGTAVDDALIDRLGLARSSYEGPTGIVGVLQDACARAGLPAASLWAAVPTYVPGAPSPKAALALVERTCELLDVALATTDLEIASASYERQIDELVDEDDETAGYVADLEARYDAGEVEEELTDVSSLVEEVERFLRSTGDN
ncbi:MAG: PAC2 family protein [Acidimicrobiales bacterium]|nr:PAC2 family protein [Acidimicrobiales bacterium]MCB1017292.1 PAC2 family protein [Acidimicrobiales bacterium]MCB9373743.1 PAC2 family protein [Microthrixaceae bacterium]